MVRLARSGTPAAAAVPAGLDGERDGRTRGPDDLARPHTPVRPGERLSGRYRLVEALPASPGGDAELWRAVDEVLGRPVAVTLLVVRSREAARPFLAGAARSGAVLAPGLVRTFDADVEERPGCDGAPPVAVAYVISAWVDGRALSDVLADGPVSCAEAVRWTAEVARALGALHRAGVSHGRLGPRVLVLTAERRVVVTGAAVSAVLHRPAPDHDDRHDNGHDNRHEERDHGDDATADTRALAAVLYALLTGYWPGEPDRSGGLPPAPRRDGRPVPPRQLRGGLPRALDRVVTAGLAPAGTAPGPSADTASHTPVGPEQLADRATAALGARRGSVPLPPSPARRRRRRGPVVRRLAAWAASLALVGAAGAGGYAAGLRVGTLVPPDDPLVALPAPVAGAPGVLDLTAPGVRVRDVDPHGDGRERPAEVGRAVDGDPRTAWRTERYRSPRLDGRPGVGLLVDLGRSTALARVEVEAGAAGAAYEVRAGERPQALATVARLERAGRLARLQPRATARGRYWLLWVTRLPPDGGQFRLAVGEVRLVQR